MNKRTVFEGFRDGLPIGLGYFTVAFSLGIIAKNAGKLGTKTEDSYGDLLPDNAYDYIIRYIQKCRSKGPVNKYSIRAITHGTRAYYNVPQNYKIAVPMSDSSLADAMNSIPYKNY